MDASKQLDEVIVTAEKKEENVQAIPSSISALNAKSINDYRL
jgi:iron complex outermembrane receptor protein